MNLYEEETGRHGIKAAYRQIFKTKTGKELFRLMYGYSEEEQENVAW